MHFDFMQFGFRVMHIGFMHIGLRVMHFDFIHIDFREMRTISETGWFQSGPSTTPLSHTPNPQFLLKTAPGKVIEQILLHRVG